MVKPRTTKMIENASTHSITQQQMLQNSHWEIQYARFFNFPLSHSSSSSLLRPISTRRKCRLNGTWIASSSSNISVHIVFYDHSLSQPTLLVSLCECVYVSLIVLGSEPFRSVYYDHIYAEEHYISKLNFTWPQGSYVSECSLRESRVIFASYRDGMGQIQKFALRFSSSTESKEFMESLKYLKEARYCSSGAPRCVLTEGIDEEYDSLWQPALNQERDLNLFSEQGHAVGGTDVALPQSFSALLADFCTETDLGVPQSPTGAMAKCFLKANRVPDNFLDMMDKMDTVIIGLGGDLAI